ncbi:MAG TPA: hypothetical protein DEB39_10295 [Planctomycetaceae bacterium]|nr:hypothetical protein [Planctomycetaceae bacterium]
MNNEVMNHLKQRKPELLAPAGSEEALFAAVDNGADAVYFGIAGFDQFNARVRAKNIPLETLGETVAMLHARSVRAYITLNTLAFADELATVETLLCKIAEAGADAILVQDLGIARLARERCPSLPLHASTQMSLTSAEAFAQVKQLGINRVVLPRELSLEQIRVLRKSTDMELETFIHGSLCISFSGQCYASLMLGGRSANRGRCAQPCRMQYTLQDAVPRDTLLFDRGEAPSHGRSAAPRRNEHGREEHGRNEHGRNEHGRNEHTGQLLSPTDLAALPFLEELIAAGVHALKIEGRLKPPEYVAETTRAYRQAIDAICSNRNGLTSARGAATNKSVSNEAEINAAPNVANTLDRLALTFSRGFSSGWLEGVHPRRLVPGNITDHRGTLLGEVIEVRRDAAVVRLSAPVRRGDGVLFENPRFPDRSQGGRVYEIFFQKASVREAEAGNKVLLTFRNGTIDPEYAREGQEVRKTADPRLEREIRKSLQARHTAREKRMAPKDRIPVVLTIRAETGKPLSVRVQARFRPAMSFPAMSFPAMSFPGVSKTGTDVLSLSSESPLEEARKHPLSEAVLREQFDRFGGTRYELDAIHAEIVGRPMVPLSVLGRLRREMTAALDSAFEAAPNTGWNAEWNGMANTDPDASAKGPEPPTTILEGKSLQRLREEVYAKKKRLATSDAKTSDVDTDGRPTVYLLFRDPGLFDDLTLIRRCVDAGCGGFYVELRRAGEYERAAENIRKCGGVFLAALPRIQKPGELRLLKRIADLKPDAVLARNLGEINIFSERGIPCIADFSLNIVNDLAFEQLLDWGVHRMTPGPDLSLERMAELLDRIPPERLELLGRGRIPLFTMEHCLWKANLVPAEKSCERLCERIPLKLRDRYGAVHTVRPDACCRNMIEHAAPVDITNHLPKLTELGIRHVRLEWDARSGADILSQLIDMQNNTK